MAIKMAVSDDYVPKEGERIEEFKSCNGGLRAKRAVSFEGAVLCTREENGYDDSDFYAIVWDEKAQRLERIEYATTRGWTYDNDAQVDASPEVIQKAQDWIRKWAKEEIIRIIKADTFKPAVGKNVVTPDGKGVVFWIGKARRYRFDTPSTRVGVSFNGKTHFYDYGQVTVINPEQYLNLNYEQMSESRAERLRGCYHYPFVSSGFAVV